MQHETKVTRYATREEAMRAEVVEPVQDCAGPAHRFDFEAIAREVLEEVEEVDAQGRVSRWWQPREDFAQTAQDATALMEVAQEYDEPVAEVRTEVIEYRTHEGEWEAEVQWRPLYAVGLDPTSDRLGRTEVVWGDEPPVQIMADHAEHDTAVLARRMVQVSGPDGQEHYEAERVDDPLAELEPGEYRVLSVTLDGQPAELPDARIAGVME